MKYTASSHRVLAVSEVERQRDRPLARNEFGSQPVEARMGQNDSNDSFVCYKPI